ncbi:hypothetical protein CHUAL_009346 [Chamberlinius hualienensis]
MFNKFATVLHNAVDALAPSLPPREEFIYHWKAVTKFFVDKRSGSRDPIEFTNLPGHLDEMLLLLTLEANDENGEVGKTGPCLEYLLQNKLLDTLQALALADCPPGMKPYTLVFVGKLLVRIHQPLLPHVNVYKPINNLIKLCGEIKAAPSENEEMHFLRIICSKLEEDPSLVNLFLEARRTTSLTDSDHSRAGLNQQELPSFYLVDSLVTLCQSADNGVVTQACESLKKITKLPVDLAASCIIEETKLSNILADRLCSLHSALPKTMDPDAIEACYTDIDKQITDAEEPTSFPGRRQLLSFLTWLHFCDDLIQGAYPLVGKALARAIHFHFLERVMGPLLSQISDTGVIVTTAVIIKCVKEISSELLLQEFGYFLLGETQEIERPGVTLHPIKQLLLERCFQHDDDEVALITLKLFETLIENPVSTTLHQLVLSNLLSRDYYDHSAVNNHETWSDDEDDRYHGDLEMSPGSSPISRTMAPSNIHKIINCFLLILPDELKSCDIEEEMGYDSYLRDAQRQFRHCAEKCSTYDWPQEALSREEMHQSDTSSSESQAEADRSNEPFYEGSFLAMLFDRIEGMTDQSYDINLQITSIMSKLCHLPHPNLHEFLLNPLIPLSEGARTLFTCLEKVATSTQVRIQKVQGFKRKLNLTRKILLGESTETNNFDSSGLLEGLIVFEEFCKELAAISFVKCHAAS